jgi:membrane fusion protein, multidrug efflux system
MIMRRSTLIAALLAIAVGLWLASPHLGLDRWLPGGDSGVTAEAPAGPEAAPAASPAASNAERLTAVRTRQSVAAPMAREIVLNGRTEVNRTVRLAAETAARVVELPRRKGEQVAAGDRIAQLDQRDREAALAEACAMLARRELDYEAARRLGERGFQAETRVAEALAALELARYHLRRTEVDLSHTELDAPFAGVLEALPVELGSFVDVGETIAEIVDLDPILVVTDVPEARIGSIRPGENAAITLVDGSRHDGRVRFVARQANDQTRTFRVEVEVANPDAVIPAGISTTVAITLDPVPAHRVSPGILVLDDAGRLGIKSVAEDATVTFHAADIIRAEADAVWLAGLPEQLQIITVGQGFVMPGQRVAATDEAEVTAGLVDDPR